MRVRVLVLPFIALTGCFSASDWVIQGAAMGTLAGDAVQTVNIQSRGHEDTNPILGKHPSTAWIVTYFTICLGVEVGVSALLPEGALRSSWESAWAAAETYQVGFNDAARRFTP